MTRTVMWGLLALVSASAAVLSFDSLRTLATLCGYPASLSALFPVTVDAGAAAACLTWLDRKSAATSVGRTLTWTLLVASVGMNAVVHYLDAYRMQPAWWLIVGVSAIPPATLGATVHLAVLLGRDRTPDFIPADIPAPEDVPVPPVRAGNPSPKPASVTATPDKTATKTAKTAEAEELRRAKNREYQRRHTEKKRLAQLAETNGHVLEDAR